MAEMKAQLNAEYLLIDIILFSDKENVNSVNYYSKNYCLFVLKC